MPEVCLWLCTGRYIIEGTLMSILAYADISGML